MGFGSGQGVKCYHSEHLYGEFWHRAFTVSPDTPLCELPDFLRRERRGVRRRGRRLAPRERAHPRHEARPGRAAPVGHRRVLGRMGADQAEDRRRVPVRARSTCCCTSFRASGSTFRSSREHTGSPYLVGPNGYYLRDRATRKPLVWDAARGAAVAVRHARHRRSARRALSTSMRSRSARTSEVLGRRRARSARPRSRSSSPTWRRTRRNGRRAICDVPAATMRRIAQRVHRPRPRRARRSRSKARRCPTGRWR